jgi:glycosyltransferase involved in cell wall biosynthesis
VKAAVAAPGTLPQGDFQRRRDVNLVRLQKVDLLVAQSSRVAQIYQQLGVPASKLRTIHLTVKHLDRIQPRRMDPIAGRVRFVALNGLITVQKGAMLLLDALRILNSQGLADRFELHTWGGMKAGLASEVASFPNLHHHGWYQVAQLDRMLDSVHVGLIPSTWEEAFGYVGVELLAKGVPIIGNARGGMLDYTVEGVSGWLNHSNDAAGLAGLMAGLIEDPDRILAMDGSILANRERFVKPMSAHAAELEDVYDSLICAPARRLPQSGSVRKNQAPSG